MYAPSGLLRGESQRGVAERHALPLCPLSSCLTTASPLRHRLPFRKTHLKRATAPVRGQPRPLVQEKRRPRRRWKYGAAGVAKRGRSTAIRHEDVLRPSSLYTPRIASLDKRVIRKRAPRRYAGVLFERASTRSRSKAY